jgi:TolA-binding protein
MTSLAFMECCQRLCVTPKTLRQWLAQAEMSLHTHPTDARITCLTSEQLQLLAALHGRLLQPSGNPLVGGGLGPGEITDTDLRTRLAQLEAQVAALQTQLTDLTFQLLREREQRTEQRLQALEAQLRLVRDDALAPLSGSAPRVPEQPEMPSFMCHPTEKQTPLIPLIE